MSDNLNESNESNESTETEAASVIGWIKTLIPESMKNFEYWKWARRLGGIATAMAVVTIAIVLTFGLSDEEADPSADGSSAGSTVPGVTLSTEEYEALVQERVDAEVDSSLLRGRFNERVDKRVDQLVEAEVAKAMAELPRTVDMDSEEVGTLIGKAVDERLTSLVTKIDEREAERKIASGEFSTQVKELTEATKAKTLRDLRYEYLTWGNKYTGLPVIMATTSASPSSGS